MDKGPTDAPAPPDDVSTCAISPTAENAGSRSHRKQVLLGLLDALAELSREEEVDGLVSTQNFVGFDDNRDVPTIDEHMQNVGADTFNKFQSRITNLDKELRNLDNATRHLGSSVGILSSSYRLRERLAQILHLFHDNAADLFPRKIPRRSRKPSNMNIWHFERNKRRRIPSLTLHSTTIGDPDPEDFPLQLQMFAQDMTTLLDCLDEFPEFTNEALRPAILSFESELKHWASSLNAYKGRFRNPAVQRFLHDLGSEMGEHLDSIALSLPIFIKIGVPTIHFAQKRASQNMLNITTVATFFSAITATTMQFSYSVTDSTLSRAVNSFWFTSLVFSIGAAINSLLGATWKQAVYRSPGHRVPWWVLFWIKRSPLAFLVLSIACFSMGLVLFAYSSQQDKVTRTLTTVFTACSLLGLTAVSGWMALERWIFSRHSGTIWLADFLSERRVAMRATMDIQPFVQDLRGWTLACSCWTKRLLRQLGDTILELNALTIGSDREAADTERGDISVMPVPSHSTPETPANTATAKSEESIAKAGRDDSTKPDSRARLANTVRTVMKTRAAGHDTGSADLLEKTLWGTLVPQLRDLQPTQSFDAHVALVRSMQFSPNGKFLATSSWDRTSVIFKVGDPFTYHRVLAHPQGFVGQVAWHPDGRLLLTKLGRGMKIWTEDGVCKQTVDRHRLVQFVIWLPSGDAFLSIEGSDVMKLDLKGIVLATYQFPDMTLYNASVTQDGSYMICVGMRTTSSRTDDLHTSRNEKLIIVYNMIKQEIEDQVPVFHEVRDITLTKNDQFALVSFESNMKVPPQLWKLTWTRESVRLSLKHTYLSKSTVEFVGPGSFGGANEQIVLCAGQAGDVYIWDRESGIQLHHIRAQTVGGDLTCIAWNHAWDTFMFATGSHDGGVRIWTTPSHITSSPVGLTGEISANPLFMVGDESGDSAASLS